MQQFQGLLGIVGVLAIGYVLSADRRRVDWRVVGGGVLLQLVIAVGVLKVGPVQWVFERIAAVVARVITFADAGIVFVFGDKLIDKDGPWGFVFAVKVLPVIVFFASLMAVLYHLGVMQRVVAGMAWVLRRTMGITGAEALSASANIFVGQTEAPLTVKPYVAGMTRSQLMAVMVGGFATIAGSVMAAYIGMLGEAYGQIEAGARGLTGEAAQAAAQGGRELFAKHLLCASIMSAPAGLVMAKLMLPESESPRPESVEALMSDERTTRNVVDAAASGAGDGLRLALNVAAMLVAFVALLAMINYPLSALSAWGPVASWREAHGIPVLSLQNILGWVLMPLAWLIGVPWREARELGALMGTQVIATEFVAYLQLAQGVRSGGLEPRTAAIATYCLCGFANVASIGIQIGGLSALAPERRGDLAQLAPRAMLAGALACWMTGAVAGLFIA